MTVSFSSFHTKFDQKSNKLQPKVQNNIKWIDWSSASNGGVNWGRLHCTQIFKCFRYKVGHLHWTVQLTNLHQTYFYCLIIVNFDNSLFQVPMYKESSSWDYFLVATIKGWKIYISSIYYYLHQLRSRVMWNSTLECPGVVSITHGVFYLFACLFVNDSNT